MRVQAAAALQLAALREERKAQIKMAVSFFWVFVYNI